MHIPWPHLRTHETKRHVLRRFILVLAVFLLYFLYVANKYGLRHGLFITILTWSFFVLCTPIADAGFLLDFPLRVILGIRMIKSEAMVWAFAITLNILTILFAPQVYQTTLLLQLFHHILTTPIPYWLIIILSFVGTFLSIYFGDELLDVVFHHERRKYFLHKDKYELIAFVAVFLLTLAFYNFLLNELGIHLF